MSEPKDFEIYNLGIVCASVCSSLPVEEVKRRMASEPTGISSKWTLSEDKTFSGGQSNPCPCNDNPDTHKHYLFNC